MLSPQLELYGLKNPCITSEDGFFKVFGTTTPNQFTNSVFLGEINFFPKRVHSYDDNNDGIKELYTCGPVELYRNVILADNYIAVGKMYKLGKLSTSLILDDFNRDGLVDLFSTGTDTNTGGLLFYNTPEGSFSDGIEVPDSPCDLNGDGS